MVGVSGGAGELGIVGYVDERIRVMEIIIIGQSRIMFSFLRCTYLL